MKTKLTLMSLALMMGPSLVRADEQVGVWNVANSTRGGSSMYTTVGGEHTFGRWCESGACFWQIVTPMPCDARNGSVPMLFAAAQGSLAVPATCAGARSFNGKDFYRYRIDRLQALDQAATSSPALAVAVAMRNSEFRILRFETNGADRALAELNRRTPAVPAEQAQGSVCVTARNSCLFSGFIGSSCLCAHPAGMQMGTISR